MIELVFLTLMNRLTNWGLGPIIATRRVAANAAVLHRLLADPANQLRLANDYVDAGALRAAGERCEAPLRRGHRAGARASLRVRPSSSGRVLTSELQIGRRTAAWITWILSADRGTTEVDVAVSLESRGIPARLFLLLGGRRRIARRLDSALARLATASAHVAEHPSSSAVSSRHENARWRLCPGPAVASSDPGQGLRWENAGG